MKRRILSSFRSRLIVIGIAPIILVGGAAIFNSAVAAANTRRVAELFSLDLFMKETLANVDAVVANLAVYIDTKNSDSLRAYMHISKQLSAKAAILDTGPSYREDLLLERNVAVLIRRLIDCGEAAIRAKRGRNIPEYIAQYQEVTLIASFIHDQADALSLERLGSNLDSFSKLAKDINKVSVLLAVMILSAMIFSAAAMTNYSLKLTEPLDALAASAARISKGDFSGGPISAAGEDEIGQTARAFNVMQASVESYIDEIKSKAAVESSLMEEKLKNLEMAGHLRSAELKALQARINPHFLFNTLNTGIQLATVEDADNTRVFLERLAGLMRYSFRELDQPVALRDELSCLRDYLYLLSIRFPETISFTINAEPETESALMPKLIVQPLVENSIHHGLGDKSQGGHIRIHAKRVHGEEIDEIVLSIEDNGIGMKPEVIASIFAAADENREIGSSEGGLGLANVIARLRLFAGRREVLAFEDARPGTRVVIRLPFQEAY